MSLLRPALRPALNPIQRAINGIDSITRYFTQFDTVAQSYVSYPEITNLSGNLLEFEAVFSITNLSSTNNILSLYSSDSNENIGLNILDSASSGSLKFFSSGYTPGQGPTNVADGRLHKVLVRVDKTTGDFTVFLDGDVEYTGTHSNPSAISDAYYVSAGARISQTGGAATFFSDAVVADCRILSDSSVVFFSPVDQNYTPANNVVDDEVGGYDGTFVNVAEADSVLYTFEDPSWVSDSRTLEVAY